MDIYVSVIEIIIILYTYAVNCAILIAVHACMQYKMKPAGHGVMHNSINL